MTASVESPPLDAEDVALVVSAAEQLMRSYVRMCEFPEQIVTPVVRESTRWSVGATNRLSRDSQRAWSDMNFVMAREHQRITADVKAGYRFVVQELPRSVLRIFSWELSRD